MADGSSDESREKIFFLPDGLRNWFERLGTSGQLLLFGGFFGLQACLSNPLWTFKSQAFDSPISASVSILDDWRGVVCLLGNAGILALLYFLYPADKQKHLARCGAVVVLAVGCAVCATWLFVDVVTHSHPLTGSHITDIRTGLGGYLNAASGIAVVIGAGLKLKEGFATERAEIPPGTTDH